MKQNKIIAVDTSLGTNFLISACNDATVSELRGLIQKGHFSCFPEHGLLNVLALTVEYSQRQYHVTDSLLIGQIFRKSWNTVHAELSSGSGSLRAVPTFHCSKSAEAESLPDNRTRNHCAGLDDILLPKSAGTKSLGVDRDSDEALGRSPSPLLCGEKVLKCCNDIVPVVSNCPISWLNCERFRHPLLSTEEAPYTQSHSQLNVATKAAVRTEVLDKGCKHRKRKFIEEEILSRKQKQPEINSDRDEDLSPGEKMLKGVTYTQERNIQQCNQEAFCRDDFSEELALINGDAQLAEACNKSENRNLQSDNILDTNICMADNSIQGKHCKDPPLANSEAFVENSSKMKTRLVVCKSPHSNTEKCRSCEENMNLLKSSLNEKEFTTMETEAVNQALDKVGRGGGDSFSKTPTGNEAEGIKEYNSGDRVCKRDFSMGYPIQLNDRSILLVASLSAEVVPETQESQMQSQDVKNVEDEEVVRGLENIALEPHGNCCGQEHVKPQETVAQESPFHPDRVNENFALHTENKENSSPKPCVAVDAPSESFTTEKNNAGNDTEILGAHYGNDKCEGQLHETGLTGGNHDVNFKRKKKKRKRRKILEVPMAEGSWFAASGGKSQDIQGATDPKKDVEESSLLLDNPTEAHNYARGQESRGILGEQAQTQVGHADVDPKEIQKQNATELNVHEKTREKTSFIGDEIMALGKVLIAPSLEKKSGGECIEGSSKRGGETMQGELLGRKQGAGTTHKKKKKRKKERTLPHPEGASGEISPKMGNEGDLVPFSIKDLPNVLRQSTTKEGESHRKKKTKLLGEQVTVQNSKKIETDPNIGLMQDQGQDNTAMEPENRNVPEPLLKDGLVGSSSTRTPPKEFSQEVKTKPSFDVFNFESSETATRPKENCIDMEVTSNLEANNLEKLCSVAVKLVEDNILNSSQMIIRKSSRKAVHPKRWITVLSERLHWNQGSKNNSKKQRARKRNKLTAEGTSPPKDGELNPEPLYVEGGEGVEESSQGIIDDGRVACPAGCGKLYSKKTSAYYRHSKKCSGGDY